MTMYKFLSTVLCFVWMMSFAQGQDISMHMMDSIYARTSINPAYRFDQKIVIDLPSVYVGAYTNGVSIGDLLIDNGGLNEIKLKEGISEINDINYLTGESSVSLIGLGLNLGKLQLSSGYKWHYQGSTNYTRDLFLLAANGNAPYIGQTLDVGPDLLLQSYHEIYLGASYQLSTVSIGARVKLLSGINDISTENASVKLTTDEEIYQLRIESDYELNTTGVVDYNGLNDIDVDTDRLSDELFANLFGDNTGVALDLGIDWKVNDKFNVSASLLDLGSISWNKDVTNYISQGDNVFDGVDILDYIDDDQEVVLEDSLYNLLKFEESNEEYSTSVGAKIHLSARYHASPKHTLGVNYYKASNAVNSRYYFAINSQYQVLSWLSLGTGYGTSSNSSFLVPFNAMLHFGVFDFFISTDNILSGFSVQSSKVSSLRLGAQLGF